MHKNNTEQFFHTLLIILVVRNKRKYFAIPHNTYTDQEHTLLKTANF